MCVEGSRFGHFVLVLYPFYGKSGLNSNVKHVRVGQGHQVRVWTVLCAGRVILNFSSVQVTK